MKILPKIPDDQFQTWLAMAKLETSPSTEFGIFREYLKTSKEMVVLRLTGQKDEELRVEGCMALQVFADIEELLSIAPKVLEKIRKK